MTSQLRKLDQKSEILANEFKHGRISEAQFAAKLRKLVDRAEVLLARMG